MWLLSLFVVFFTGFYFYLKSFFKRIEKETNSLVVAEREEVEEREMTLEETLNSIPFVIHGEVLADKDVEEGEDLIKRIPFIVREGEVLVLYKGRSVVRKGEGECVFLSLGDTLNFECRAVKKSKISLVRSPNKYVSFLILKKKCIEIAFRYFNFNKWLLEKERSVERGVETDSELNPLQSSPISHISSTQSLLKVCSLLKISNPERLREMILFRVLQEGEVLKERGVSWDSLFYIHYGEIRLRQEGEEYVFKEGDVVGYLNLFFNFYTPLEIVASRKTKISVYEYNTLKKNGFDEESLDMALLREVPDFVRLVDVSCEWMVLKPGTVLLRGVPPSFFFVGEGVCKSKTREYRGGVGCEECLLGKEMEETVLVKEVSDIIKIPRELVEEFIRSRPSPLEIARVLYTSVGEGGNKQGESKIRGEYTRNKSKGDSSPSISPTSKLSPSTSISPSPTLSPPLSPGNIFTVLPADKETNVLLFTRRLKGSIGRDCLLLGSRDISEVLSTRAFTPCEELRVVDYLKRMTKSYPVVIVYIENEYSRYLKYLLKYSKTCLVTGTLPKCPKGLFRLERYCDIEYVRLYERVDSSSKGDRYSSRVGDRDSSSKGDRYSRYSSSKGDRYSSSKGDRYSSSKGDRYSSSKGDRYSSSKGDRYSRYSSSKDRDNTTTTPHTHTPHTTPLPLRINRVHHVLSPSRTVLFDNKDFERLGRFLLNRRIGLVLSGGGARGIAHIGVIQALEEEGIPIDIVGGTSMGAFIGALYARDCDNGHVFRETKKFCTKAGSVWPFISDLTYPICSVFSGRAMNASLKDIFRGQNIEDLWVEYFCLTTNLFTNDEEVHRSGPVWKYVRASMGICGYLPPVCDPRGFLVDGGYLNNVPADVMLSMGVSLVMAIDIGTVLHNDYDSYGEDFNGFVAFFHKYFKTRKYLTMEEIQYRIAFLTTEKKLREVENNSKVLMMRPDLGDIKTGEFRRFDEIVAQGYQAAREKIKEWKKTGVYKKYFENKDVKKSRRRYSV